MADKENLIPTPPPLPDIKLGEQVIRASRPNFEPALIHFAINNGNLEEVKELISIGLDMNYYIHGNTPLFLAILKEHLDIACLLADSGADVTKPERFRWLRQPIHLAAHNGYVDLMKKLLDRGANIHAADAACMTPLHWAAYSSHIDIVRLLLERGTHVNIKDDRGRTPLFRAVEGNNTEIVSLLIEYGAVVNTRDIMGWSPWIHSIIVGHVTMLNHLLSYGATIDINTRDNTGSTALHVAVSRTDSRWLKLMCLSGVDLYRRERRVPTAAVHEAVHGEDCAYDIVNILLDYGIDVNACDISGNTAFSYAANKSYKGILLNLLSAGADVAKEDFIMNQYWPDHIQYDPPMKSLLTNLAKPHMVSLKQKCRLIIRKSLAPFITSKIQQLVIPTTLKDFLLISFDTIPGVDN